LPFIKLTPTTKVSIKSLEKGKAIEQAKNTKKRPRKHNLDGKMMKT
jgi:hypothetical protein